MGCTSSKIVPDYHSPKYPENIPGSATESSTSRAFKHASLEKQLKPGDVARHKVLTILNSEVSKYLSREENKPVQKALFLGTGESGKSTVFKQMRICYGNSFDEFERQQYSKLIWSDTLRAIRVLIDLCDEERHSPDTNEALRRLVTSWLGDPLIGTDPHQLGEYIQLIQSLCLSRRAFLEAEADVNSYAFLHNHVAVDGQLSAPYHDDIMMQKGGHEKFRRNNILSQAMAGHVVKNRLQEEAYMDQLTMTPPGLEPTRANITEAVYQVWKNCPETIKRMVLANQLGLETNAGFFLNKIQDLRDSRYLATNEDILHARIKTTGITTTEFNVKANSLVVMDVGGQRVERKKWLHSFDDISCILFVASVSEYDQGLEEESAVNRLDEALEVFAQTVNSQWFRAKSVQLFLNKVDILNQKCHYSSFRTHFPRYAGSDDDPDAIIKYIESMFRERFRAGSRNLYVHQTCATDTTTMKFVIDAASDMILFENLKWAGMV